MKLIQGDCLEVMRKFKNCCIDTIITDPPYALEFMGKGWDKVLPDVKVWKEALRVAKPGAMLLAFGGTRTYHRLTCAIEDAGWEIRDSIENLFSFDERIHVFFNSLNNEQKGAFSELTTRGGVLSWLYGSGFPKSTNISKNIDKMKGAKREKVATGQTLPDIRADNYENSSGKDRLVEYADIPATPEAQLWEGWGTALKPAWEPIVVAM